MRITVYKERPVWQSINDFCTMNGEQIIAQSVLIMVGLFSTNHGECIADQILRD